MSQSLGIRTQASKKCANSTKPVYNKKELKELFKQIKQVATQKGVHRDANCSLTIKNGCSPLFYLSFSPARPLPFWQGGYILAKSEPNYFFLQQAHFYALAIGQLNIDEFVNDLAKMLWTEPTDEEKLSLFNVIQKEVVKIEKKMVKTKLI